MKGRAALLVIDMLNDFIRHEGALPVPQAEDIIEPIKNLIHEFRKLGNPVIYICDTHRGTDREFEVWGTHAVEGTWGAQVIDELKPEAGEPVIKKRRFSGFYGTDLDLTLRELGVSTLVATGVLTNICVMYTVTDARQLGYEVYVASDGVAAVSEDMHRFALKQMEEVTGAVIAESSEILKKLL